MTCGECKYIAAMSDKWGWCDASVPLWVKEELGDGCLMNVRTDSTDCPCFERKEEK